MATYCDKQNQLDVKSAIQEIGIVEWDAAGERVGVSGVKVKRKKEKETV